MVTWVPYSQADRSMTRLKMAKNGQNITKKITQESEKKKSFFRTGDVSLASPDISGDSCVSPMCIYRCTLIFFAYNNVGITPKQLILIPGSIL